MSQRAHAPRWIGDLLVVGFADSAELVRAMGKVCEAKVAFATTSSYRSGEMRITAPTNCPRYAIVVSDVTADPSSAFRVMVLAAGLRAAGAERVDLIAPWIAYGRQDRAAAPGDSPAGIVAGQMLSQAFDQIVTLDAHSEAFIRSFNGKLVNRLPRLSIQGIRSQLHLIVAPDQGALSRAEPLARQLAIPCISLEKTRTPESVSSQLVASACIPIEANVLIIDDMSDSGGTVLAAAGVLQKAGVSRISALVTHALDFAALSKKLHQEGIQLEAIYDHQSKRLSAETLQDLLTGLEGSAGERFS